MTEDPPYELAADVSRRSDDPDLSQGVWKTALKRADWEEVASLCVSAISEKSKRHQTQEAICHDHDSLGAGEMFSYGCDEQAM